MKKVDIWQSSIWLQGWDTRKERKLKLWKNPGQLIIEMMTGMNSRVEWEQRRDHYAVNNLEVRNEVYSGGRRQVDRRDMTEVQPVVFAPRIRQKISTRTGRCQVEMDLNYEQKELG